MEFIGRKEESEYGIDSLLSFYTSLCEEIGGRVIRLPTSSANIGTHYVPQDSIPAMLAEAAYVFPNLGLILFIASQEIVRT